MDQITNVCNQIAEKIPLLKQKGYEKGYADGQAAGGGDDWYNTFWDVYQMKGKRTSYIGAFNYTGWHDSIFCPKYDIIPTNNCSTMFNYSNILDIKGCLESAGVIFDTSKCTIFDSIYNNAKAVYAPTLNMLKGTSAKYLCIKAASLISAPLKNISGVTSWLDAFKDATSLTDIGQENVDFGYFSTSVDLSQTAIRFDTDKMSLLNYLTNSTQENSWLKLNPSSQQELKLSSAQIAAAQEHLDLVTGGTENFMSLITEMGWTVTKV